MQSNKETIQLNLMHILRESINYFIFIIYNVTDRMVTGATTSRYGLLTIERQFNILSIHCREISTWISFGCLPVSVFFLLPQKSIAHQTFFILNTSPNYIALHFVRFSPIFPLLHLNFARYLFGKTIFFV